jgi:hypothetical protein
MSANDVWRSVSGKFELDDTNENKLPITLSLAIEPRPDVVVELVPSTEASPLCLSTSGLKIPASLSIGVRIRSGILFRERRTGSKDNRLNS